MQAAQASYSGQAQHQKKGMCATISSPTLYRLRVHSLVSYSIVWWAAEPTSPEPPPKKQKVDETDYVQVEEDLKKKKVSELKKDAKALGASEAAISDADDTSSPKTRLLTSS